MKMFEKAFKHDVDFTHKAVANNFMKFMYKQNDPSGLGTQNKFKTKSNIDIQKYDLNNFQCVW